MSRLWTCDKCTLENEPHIDTCAACLSPRTTVQVVKIESAEDLNELGAGISWSEISRLSNPNQTEVLEALESLCKEKSGPKHLSFSSREFVRLAISNGWAKNGSEAVKLLQTLLVDEDAVNRTPYVLHPIVLNSDSEFYRIGRRYFAKSKKTRPERIELQCSMCSFTELRQRPSPKSGGSATRQSGGNEGGRDIWKCTKCTFENEIHHDHEGETTDWSSSLSSLTGAVLNKLWRNEIDVAKVVRESIAEAIIGVNDNNELKLSDLSIPDFLAKDRRCFMNRLDEQDGLQCSYAPVVMRRIREYFGVTEDFFVESLLSHDLILKSGDGGRSGAVFLFSSDKHFVVKSLAKKEAQLLMRLLRDLYDFYLSNPDSLLPRVYGMYKIMINGTKRHFIVTNNAFDSVLSIDEVYDLKGSTANRFVTTIEQKESVDSGKQPILKDLNWKKSIVLNPDMGAALLTQIHSDTHFLSSHNLMDYSLLVGVHVEALDQSSEGWWGVRRNRFQRNFGGLSCSATGATFFISIIDVLQEYDFSKVAERFVKTKIISTVSAYFQPGQREVDISCASCSHQWKEPSSDLISATQKSGSKTLFLYCGKCRSPVEVAPLQQLDPNISSIDPVSYRTRFVNFVQSQVLRV